MRARILLAFSLKRGFFYVRKKKKKTISELPRVAKIVGFVTRLSSVARMKNSAHRTCGYIADAFNDGEGAPRSAAVEAKLWSKQVYYSELTQ